MENRSLKNAYITRVLAPIKDADAQEEMALELSVHLDERIQYYIDLGYDDETAERKAVKDMGDPEPVGESLSKLHPKEWVGLAVLALLPLPLIPFILFVLIFIFNIAAGLFPAILEVLLIYLLALSRYGQKRGNRLLCTVPVCILLVVYGGLVYISMHDECSALVMTAACLLTGDFTCLRTFPVVGDITCAVAATCDSRILLFPVPFAAGFAHQCLQDEKTFLRAFHKTGEPGAFHVPKDSAIRFYRSGALHSAGISFGRPRGTFGGRKITTL